MRLVIIIILCLGYGAFCLQAGELSRKKKRLDLENSERGFKDELKWLEAETYVVTASKVRENIRRSASTISVITSEQINQMGARNLQDVLRIIPGMGSFYGIEGQYDVEIRGVRKSASQNILLMLNGTSINSNFLGGGMWTNDKLLLENIQRIEVIRGPGSALYGANAFSGVINVITKDVDDIDHLEVRATYASFDTKVTNLLFGQRFGELELTLNAQYLESAGYDGVLETDALTALDAEFGSHTSLAPGKVRRGDRKVDLSLGLRYKGWQFDGRFVKRKREPNIGSLAILNKQSVDDSNNYLLALSYVGNLWDGLDFSAKVYHHHHYFDGVVQLTPENSINPTAKFNQFFPAGMIGKPTNQNDRDGFELQLDFQGWDSHHILFGVNFEAMNQYDVTYKANHYYDTHGQLYNLGPIVDLTDTAYNYNRAVKRTFQAVYAEDIWDIREDLRLTLGARYDDYSDFGDSFNPRAGLMWNYADGYDVKLLYGRAFRVPSFYELYNNHPSIMGNPSLNPETVDTYELSFGVSPTSLLDTRVTFFHNEIENSINLDSFGKGFYMFNNKDMRLSEGVEFEAKYHLNRGSWLGMNYTYQDVMDEGTCDRIPTIPRQRVNVMANLRLNRYVNWYSEYLYSYDYNKLSGDSRETPDNYGIVNTTLILKKMGFGLDKLEVRFSVYNVLDEDYTLPNNNLYIENGNPMPGRNYALELKYSF